RAKRISTGLLNKVVNEAFALNPPSSIKGKMLRVYYTTQPKSKPPTFVLFINNKDLVKDSYKRYLLKKLRDAFGFFGVPIRLSFRQKGDK
ncbi:MAG: ribosome biogenesis GTPase Der, partial [Clostridia bacterium]|nr:ribosome biogenesis GTPase Der [Clostridia bacterium]